MRWGKGLLVFSASWAEATFWNRPFLKKKKKLHYSWVNECVKIISLLGSSSLHLVSGQLVLCLVFVTPMCCGSLPEI